jgi:hypothetical protein
MHDVNLYTGSNPKPEWNPNIDYVKKTFMFDTRHVISHFSEYPVYTLDNAFPEDICNHLIAEFEKQDHYAVGVDGYANAAEHTGSYRAMAWSESVANQVSERLHKIIDENSFDGGLDGLVHLSDLSILYTPFRPVLEAEYDMIGSTPWLRFMKYGQGGKHTPHYDAPFHNEDERYITLYSWVLYLNTPEGEGGNFQFVADGQEDVHPLDQNLNDWDHMSETSVLDIKPERGKLLVFPHWLCHQVQEYLGNDHRYIIRGDVAFGY